MLPFTVTFGHGISFGAGPHPDRLFVQWNFVQTQTGVDEQTGTIDVAAGSAAKAVVANES